MVQHVAANGESVANCLVFGLSLQACAHGKIDFQNPGMVERASCQLHDPDSQSVRKPCEPELLGEDRSRSECKRRRSTSCACEMIVMML